MIEWDRQPELDRLLTELWLQDIPASQIALHIAGSTKNGIISRARRIGLPRRRRTPAAKGSSMARPRTRLYT